MWRPWAVRVVAAAAILALAVLAVLQALAWDRRRPHLDWVRLPAGSFTMGCVESDFCTDNERPPHRVNIARPFRLTRTEISVREYKRFTRDRRMPLPEPPEFNPDWSLEDHPVVGVTWDEASAYCAWAGGRLPSEAEWEYAARGGREGEPYAWGSDPLPVRDGRPQANMADACARAKYLVSCPGCSFYQDYDDGHADTAPVGSFAPNGFVLLDMIGNAWEWVADDAHANYQGAPADGRAWVGGGMAGLHVTRGSSFAAGPRSARTSSRFLRKGDLRGPRTGFRCARDS